MAGPRAREGRQRLRRHGGLRDDVGRGDVEEGGGRTARGAEGEAGRHQRLQTVD